MLQIYSKNLNLVSPTLATHGGAAEDPCGSVLCSLNVTLVVHRGGYSSP